MPRGNATLGRAIARQWGRNVTPQKIYMDDSAALAKAQLRPAPLRYDGRPRTAVTLRCDSCYD